MTDGVRTPRDLRRKDFAADPDSAASTRVEEDLLPNRPYPSKLFWHMARGLDPERAPARILDLGPASNANIQFWGERGFDITCFDLYAREVRHVASQKATPLTLSSGSLRDRKLPFESGSFSAICAWNVLSRLPFVLAQRCARECHRLLAPSGVMHAIFLDVGGRLDGRRRYTIADRQRLHVTSAMVPRQLPTNWVDAEIRLMLSRFSACEIQPAPSYTREVLAQKDLAGRRGR